MTHFPARTALSVGIALFGMVTASQPAAQARDSIALRAPALAPNDARLAHRFAIVASGFASPVFVTHAKDDRLFVVEQGGLIKIIKNGRVLTQPFLDISAISQCCTEEGLLGLAFEPDYATTRRFYVYYTDNNGDQVIARYLSDGADDADEQSAVIVLTIPHPNNGNHNGGWIGFGPDNLLYAGVGDGGGGGDPDCAGENPAELRGKILRLDVVGQATYASPPSNIFMPSASQQRPEVFAAGLRNPWRNSFDRVNGDLWIADVGQSEWEEVNRLPSGSAAGANFGWSRFEGTHAYSNNCSNRTGKTETLPIYDYPHGSAGGNSVTGGYVYRGSRYPEIAGNYYFADFSTRRLWASYRPAQSSPYQTVVVTNDIGFTPSSFGEDANGELLAVDYEGSVRRLIVLNRSTWLPLTRKR